MRRYSKIVVVVLSLALSLSSVTSSDAVTAPCKFMGLRIKLDNFSVPSCANFYTHSSAIHLPADSPTAIYGVVVCNMAQSDLSATFYDRKNQTRKLPKGFVPKSIRGVKSAAQYVFKASLRSGKIIGLHPVLYIPTSTMVKPFSNSQYIGSVNNFAPVEGINTSDWVRWDFSTVDSSKKLAGTFVNLNKSVRASQMMEPPAPCEPALSVLEESTGWYTKIFGTNDAISLYWDPGMHTQMDSEYVVAMNSGITYMTGAPSINTLLAKTVRISAVTSWSIHGNPVGTPYNFEPGLGLGFVTGFSAKTPLVSC